ncbi:hypothetical protein ACSQ67_000778 [Phaseolus vulgaris]
MTNLLKITSISVPRLRRRSRVHNHIMRFLRSSTLVTRERRTGSLINPTQIHFSGRLLRSPIPPENATVVCDSSVHNSSARDSDLGHRKSQTSVLHRLLFFDQSSHTDSK